MTRTSSKSEIIVDVNYSNSVFHCKQLIFATQIIIHYVNIYLKLAV